MTTTGDIYHAMNLLGYSPVVPAGYRLAVEIDRVIAQDAVCPSCGQRGLTLLPFFRDGCSYRAVLTCGACSSHVEEF
jgi:hypothetical protein